MDVFRFSDRFEKRPKCAGEKCRRTSKSNRRLYCKRQGNIQNENCLTVYSLSLTTFKCHNEVLSAFPYTFFLEHYNISKATKRFNMDNLKKSVKQTHYFLKVIKHSNLRSNEITNRSVDNLKKKTILLDLWSAICCGFRISLI